MKYVIEVFRKQVAFCGKNDTMLSLEQENVLSTAAFPCRTTEYILPRYQEVKKEVVRSRDSGYMEIQNSVANMESFVGFIKLLSDVNATTPKSTALLTHPVCAILLRLST